MNPSYLSLYLSLSLAQFLFLLSSFLFMILVLISFSLSLSLFFSFPLGVSFPLALFYSRSFFAPLSFAWFLFSLSISICISFDLSFPSTIFFPFISPYFKLYSRLSYLPSLHPSILSLFRRDSLFSINDPSSYFNFSLPISNCISVSLIFPFSLLSFVTTISFLSTIPPFHFSLRISNYTFLSSFFSHSKSASLFRRDPLFPSSHFSLSLFQTVFFKLYFRSHLSSLSPSKSLVTLSLSSFLSTILLANSHTSSPSRRSSSPFVFSDVERVAETRVPALYFYLSRRPDSLSSRASHAESAA